MGQSIPVLSEVVHGNVRQGQLFLTDQAPDTVKQVVAMALYDDLHTGFRYLCHEINQVGLLPWGADGFLDSP